MRHSKAFFASLLLAGMTSAALANVMVYDVSIDDADVNDVRINFRVLDAVDATVKLEVFGPLPATTVVGEYTFANVDEGLNVRRWSGNLDGGGTTTAGETYGFRILAEKTTGYADYTQVNDINLPHFQFESPRGGVAAISDPESDLLGLIYVMNTRDSATATGRAMAAGIYAFYPDGSDPVGFRDTPATGGVDWTGSNFSSPFKAQVGPDNKLYIPDFSDPHSGLWRADTDLAGNFTEILDNTGRDGDGLVGTLHGSVSAVYVEESGTDLNIYWQDEDLPIVGGTSDGRRSIWTITVNDSTTFPVTTGNTVAIDENDFASHPLYDDNNNGGLGMFVNDSGGGLTKDADGNWWLAQYRAGGTDWPCLMKFNPAGDTMLWDSRTGGTGAVIGDDPLIGLLGSLAPDLENNLIYAGVPGGFAVIDAANPPTADIANNITFVEVDEGLTTCRGVEVDGAGNVYVASNMTERLHLVSPPGANSFTLENAAFEVPGGDLGPTDSSSWQLYQ